MLLLIRFEYKDQTHTCQRGLFKIKLLITYLIKLLLSSINLSPCSKSTSLHLAPFLSSSVPDGRLSAAVGNDELPPGSRRIHHCCSHHLPRHSSHLPLSAGEEVKLSTQHTWTQTTCDKDHKLYHNKNTLYYVYTETASCF